MSHFFADLVSYFEALWHHAFAFWEDGPDRWFRLVALVVFSLIGGSAAAFLSSGFDRYWPFATMLFLLLAPFLAWRAERRRVAELTPSNSTIRVRFDATRTECRSSTTFSNGIKALFFRLWVTPPAGQLKQQCAAKIVDILKKRDDGKFQSAWAAQRIPLAWASSTEVPTVTMDLRDSYGEFVDVFFITERGAFGFGSPHFLQPANFDSTIFSDGGEYVFCLSIGEAGVVAQEATLRVAWHADWQKVTAELLTGPIARA